MISGQHHFRCVRSCGPGRASTRVRMRTNAAPSEFHSVFIQWGMNLKCTSSVHSAMRHAQDRNDYITDHSTADSCCTPALLRECSLQGSLRGQARELTHALVTLPASSIMTTGQVEVRQVPSLYNDSKIAVSMMASPATGILLLPLLLHLRLLRLLLLRSPATTCRWVSW